MRCEQQESITTERSRDFQYKYISTIDINNTHK